jgi:hypothetical protein
MDGTNNATERAIGKSCLTVLNVGAARIEVEHGAVALAFAPRPIIYPNDFRFGPLRQRFTYPLFPTSGQFI